MTAGRPVGFPRLEFVVTFLISSEVCRGGRERGEGVGGVERGEPIMPSPRKQVWACKSCLHTGLNVDAVRACVPCVHVGTSSLRTHYLSPPTGL